MSVPRGVLRFKTPTMIRCKEINPLHMPHAANFANPKARVRVSTMSAQASVCSLVGLGLRSSVVMVLATRSRCCVGSAWRLEASCDVTIASRAFSGGLGDLLGWSGGSWGGPGGVLGPGKTGTKKLIVGRGVGRGTQQDRDKKVN